MSILGFLVIAVSIGLFVLTKVKPSNPIASKWSGKKSIIGVSLGIVLMSVSGLFFINKSGTATAIQYWWGGDNIVTTQGLKLSFWSKKIPMSFEIALQDVILQKDSVGNKLEELPTEEDIYYREAQSKEFADAIKADIASAIIVSIDYTNVDRFLKMADKNGSERKLVYSRIYPAYDQALKNTCKLMDAQDYISGASSKFDYYLKDQMENGMYITELDETTIPEEAIGDDSTRTVASGGIDNNKNDRQRKYKIVRDEKTGEIVRDTSGTLKSYGIKVERIAVTNVDWEKSFDDRLQDQKEQVALTQLSKQEAEKEFYETKKAIAKGEREKAQVKVREDKIKIEKLIKAETKAEVAKFKELEEDNLLKASKKSAQRTRVDADARAYKIRKEVIAGIAPEKKLQMELDAGVAKEEARAKRPVPHTMIVTDGGSGKGGGVSDGTLLQMQLIDQMSKKP